MNHVHLHEHIMQVPYHVLLTIQAINNSNYYIWREFLHTLLYRTNHLFTTKKLIKNVCNIFITNTSWHAVWRLVWVKALIWVFTGRGRLTRVLCSLEWGIGTLLFRGKFCIFISVCLWGGEDACVCVRENRSELSFIQRVCTSPVPCFHLQFAFIIIHRCIPWGKSVEYFLAYVHV